MQALCLFLGQPLVSSIHLDSALPILLAHENLFTPVAVIDCVIMSIVYEVRF